MVLTKVASAMAEGLFKMELINKILKHINKTDSCWLWTAAINKHGYGLTKLTKKTRTAHRVLYELFKGEIPEGKFVCHSCDVRHCVNPEHLWIGTTEDNMKDMSLKKRIHSRLTDQDVIEIRNCYKNEYYYGILLDLSRKFNVHESHIWAIVHNKKRLHVQGGSF
jgi:hypothetical protein